MKSLPLLGRFTLVASAGLAACTSVPRLTENRPTTVFELEERDLIPEGIAYDPRSDTFFLSSVYKAKVVAIPGGSGEPRDFVAEREHGFGGGVGMVVDTVRRELWAASAFGRQVRGFRAEEEGRSSLFRFSIDDGSPVSVYAPEDAGISHLLNDLVRTRDGHVYVTDTKSAAVYHLAPDDDRLRVFVRTDAIQNPNGVAISPDERILFVAHGSGVASVSRDDATVAPLTHPRGERLDGIDGLYFHNGTLIAVQNHQGLNRVARFHLTTDLGAVQAVEVILADHWTFNTPTTGVIVGDALYLVANSQLASYDQDGNLPPLSQLDPPVVLRVPLS